MGAKKRNGTDDTSVLKGDVIYTFLNRYSCSSNGAECSGKTGILAAKPSDPSQGSKAPRPRGQKWATFLHDHAAHIWACDFLQVTDLFFRPLFAFFIIELKTRRVIQAGITRSPSDPWVAQQLRAATPYGQAPKYLIRDHDRKFGSCFARVATTSAIEMLSTPYHTPRANAICERFPRRVRQECLDHLLILHEKQLHCVLNQYVAYFNRARPHQGREQQVPEPRGPSGSSHDAREKVMQFRSWPGSTMTTNG
jgi:transposase InsO family protein